MKYLSLALIVFCFASCGEDTSSCTQSDWIGTWTLDRATEDCNQDGVSLFDTYTFTAGTNPDEIIYRGELVTIEGCKGELSALFARFEIAGDQLEVDAYGFGCKGTLQR